MNAKTKLLVTVPIVALAGVSALYKKMQHDTIVDRFPGIPHAETKKAYNSILLDISLGRFYADGMTSDDLDAEIRKRVRSYS